MAGTSSSAQGARRAGRPLRVLHVTEAWGGGVATSIGNFAAQTPDYEHSLIYRERHDSTQDIPEGRFVDITKHVGGLLSFVVRIRRQIRRQPYDVVHVHSSVAGGLVRGLVWRMPPEHIVYSPHCYAFERRDVSSLSRRIFHLLELLLAQRRCSIIAVSPHERELALRLRRSAKVLYVPHPLSGVRAPRRSIDQTTRRKVVAIGRLCPQKDPAFFRDVVLAHSRLAPDSVDWTWIGDGDPAIRQSLEITGVEVTGWLPKAEVDRRLAEADIYVHTAAWEGAPLTIMEAAANAVPVVARRIRALESLGVPCLYDNPQAMATAIVRGLTFDETQQAAWRSALSEDHRPSKVSQQIRLAYSPIDS